MQIATEQRFGIFSDQIAGIGEDFPSILMSRAFLTKESENVTIRYNEAKRMPGRLKEFLDANGNSVKTPDGNPVIRYHRHFDKDGIEYLFKFTKAHIYRWRTDILSFDTMFTCSADCTLWDSVSYNGKIIATNNVDKVIIWSESSPGTAFSALGSASGLDLDGGTTYLTCAKYIAIFENYVILGFTTEGGTVCPYRIRWCSYGDHTDWRSTGGQGDAGAKDFKEQSDRMKGFGHYNAYGADMLVAFKTESSHFMWLVESDAVFATSKISYAGGLLATHSVINDKDGQLYYLANDYTIKKLKFGTISQKIDKTLKDITPDSTLIDAIESAFIDEYNHLCWSIPSTINSTGNDKLIRYNLDTKNWEFDSFSIRAFGDFSRQTSYTIDTIPFSTIDGITWETIDSVENVVGFPLDICSDYSGYTWSLHSADNDCASSYNSKLVLSTDLTDKQALFIYKRIWNMLFFLKRKTAGNIDIFAKEDNQLNFQSIGSVSMIDENEPEIVAVDLPCDLRARHLLLKCQASSSFELLGVVFSFAFDGER